MERIVKLFKRERGFTLIEVVIALAVFAIISIAFFTALITAQKALLLSKERAIAESLARSQMEIVKESLFAGFYPSSVDPEYSEKGYTANIDADLIALGLQKITVTVYINGEEVWELEGYKSDR
jgi:prepilin-type N-terminal cleavage/methylation domain-containing protein